MKIAISPKDVERVIHFAHGGNRTARETVGLLLLAAVAATKAYAKVDPDGVATELMMLEDTKEAWRVCPDDLVQFVPRVKS